MTTYIEALTTSIENNNITYLDILLTYRVPSDYMMNKMVHYAMDMEFDDVAVFLYSKIKNKNDLYKQIFNPIIRAIIYDNKKLVHKLILSGTDVNYQYKGTSLIEYANRHNSIESFRILLQYGADTEKIRYKRKSKKIKQLISFWK